MEPTPLTASDAADWSYRGEGAVNLVLGYRGSSPAFIGKVLRVQKVPRDGPTNGAVLSEHERLVWGAVEGMAEAPSREEAGRAFVVGVMRELLGRQHVDVGVRVPVSKEFLATIEKNIAKQRPAWRADAAIINTAWDHALLLSDHAVFPHAVPKYHHCITVEIKPKCGFLPSSKFISERNAIKKHVTRFRMHQLLKLDKGEVLQPSEYNPTDLFSESRNLINKAIMALFASPQNNLRVFLDGSIIFGALGGSADRADGHGDNLVMEDTIKCLLQVKDGLALSTLQELLSVAILKSKVLNRLIEAQKLDKIDVEGAIHCYYNIIAKPCSVCQNLNNATLSQRFASLHSLTMEESVKIVREYLIAATAKDCSLMISFIPASHLEMATESNTIFLESTKQIFEYKASFIDLDLKPLDKMVHYYELDQKIVNLYTKMSTKKASLCSTNDLVGKPDDGHTT